MESNNQPITYHDLSVEQTLAKLQTNLDRGLSAAEVLERREKYGPNEFAQVKRKGVLAKFIDQFKNFMIIVLLIAAVISGVVGYLHGEGFTDAIIILIIVIVNALIGLFQELKAENSLEALKKMSAPKSKVVRDGQVEVLASRELVPGDIVVIETGDLIPADLRLAEVVNLKVEEAALTGESVPEEKFTHAIDADMSVGDRDNMGFSSSIVTYGRGLGIVTATGMDTEVGKIAAMIQAAPDTKTPMQIKIDQLGRFLGITALTICVLIFLAGYFQGREVIVMFMIAVSLAAAAIPEGLPAVSTIVMAVGVQRLAKKHAIVRNLSSVETLGSCGIICSDKTGTLTQNKMTVVRLYTDNQESEPPTEPNEAQSQLMRIMILANDAKLSKQEDQWQTAGDPTETAMLDLGLKYNLNKNELDAAAKRVAEVPFDSGRKMMTTVTGDADDSMTVCTKGGLDEVLACCTHIWHDGYVKPLDEERRSAIRLANERMAAQALRVLAAAYKPIEQLPAKIEAATLEKDLVFAGMLGMIDPQREEVKAAVATCRAAGIKPVMITGDHLITAMAIAEALGIREPNDEVMTGKELERISDMELEKKASNVSVYARVSPEHKVRIVQALQALGQVVAMIGDGVNDAPALKLADIGVAMGITGTDVSKEAADVVLTDDNFATIVVAVEEGRRIYDNILKAIQFMLSTNIGEIIVIFIAIVANWATPLLPIQILWINLVTDSFPALALSVDPAADGIMQRKPVDARKGIMRGTYLVRILLQGLMIGGLSLAAFIIGSRTSVEVAQTMTFAVLAFTQITHVLNVRTAHESAFKHMFTNKWLWGALVLVIALMIVVLEVPYLHDIFHLAHLSSAQWIWVVCLSLAPLPIVEIVKLVWRVRNKSADI